MDRKLEANLGYISRKENKTKQKPIMVTTETF
jgi:hypothetical protein